MTSIDDVLAYIPDEISKLKRVVQRFPDAYPHIIKARKPLYDFVISHTSWMSKGNTFTYKMSTRLWMMFNDIENWENTRVRCKTCNQPLYGKNTAVNGDFPQFCCSSCQVKNKDTQRKTVETNIKRYGVAHPSQNQHVKDKTQHTCIERYGSTSFVGSVEGKQKSFEAKTQRYGNGKFVNPAKAKETNVLRYGCENVFQHEAIRRKCSDTKMKRYGNRNFTNPLKGKTTRMLKNNGKYVSDEQQLNCEQTNLQKYGVKNVAQSEISKEHCRETNSMKYGVNWVSQCPDIQMKQHHKYVFEDDVFDSKDEIVFFIWNRDIGNEITHNKTECLKYEFDGKTYSYFPDFIVNGKFIEIKGAHFFKEDGTMFCPWRKKEWTDAQYAWMCDKYEAKHQCMIENNVQIIIDTSKEFHKMQDHITHKYGKNFISHFIKKSNDVD